MSKASSTPGGLSGRTQKQVEGLQASMRDAEVPWTVHAEMSGFKIVEGNIPKRGALNKQGKEVLLTVNVWEARSEAVRDKTSKYVVYQYDVDMRDGKGGEPTLRKVKERAWYSKAVQNTLGKSWMFDNNKIAWSLSKVEAFSVQVDLNIEDGRQESKPDSKQLVMINVKPARKIDFKTLGDMLEAKELDAQIATNGKKSDKANNEISWSEALNVLEHVLHQSPRIDKLMLRKAFYNRQKKAKIQNIQDREYLGEGVEAAKGIFVSFRPAFMGYNPKPARSLSLNVDVANCAFWVPGKMTEVFKYLFEPFNIRDDVNAQIELQKCMAQANSNPKMAQLGFYETRLGRALVKLRRVRFYCDHLMKSGVVPKEYCIADIMPQTPAESFFEDDKGKKISVASYFLEKYKFKVGKYPIIRTTGNLLIPVEVASVAYDQRFTWKLNDKQVSKMLNFAVQIPVRRRQGIEAGVRSMNWPNDPWLKSYGISVKPTPMEGLKARLLPTPNIHFAGSSLVKPNKNAMVPGNVAITGRWQLMGKKFTLGNTKRIPNAWGVFVSQGRFPVQLDTIKRFFKDFVRIYNGHGGQLINEPYIFQGDLVRSAAIYDEFYNGTLQHAKKVSGQTFRNPQLLFWVVPDRNPDTYKAIKRQCDLRWGVASQVMQSSHVQKCQPQYISNVCMKVNAKLGGATCHARSDVRSVGSLYDPSQGLLVIGSDVTHGSVGGTDPSVAALTMSQDSTFTRYMACVETNGFRNEMIQTIPLKLMFKKMVRKWCETNKMPPKNIIYMRDGVSNEQCFKVLAEELRDLKAAITEYATEIKKDFKAPPFTVLVCTKRHHIRFFPKEGDKNGNPLPGTLLETGATLATEVDWYLNSHVALKGTARPMHYIMLANECGIPLEALQQFVYENCLQYCRATTPVSQFPAIAYAHLAAARGKLHVGKVAAMSEKKEMETKLVHGMSAEQVYDETYKKRKEQQEWEKLNPTPLIPVNQSLVDVMWYA